MASAPFQFYIPDLKWDLLQRYAGSSALYDHLVKHALVEGTADTRESISDTLQNVALEHLSVLAEDFSAEIPFTSYGLDSLSASKLSFAFKPYVTISQLQLLADLSLNDVHAAWKKAAGAVVAAGDADVNAPVVNAAPAAPHEADHTLRVAMVSKYTLNLSRHVPSVPSPSSHTILITGTTGVLGASILVQLLQRDDIERVYALNRSSATQGSVLERQKQIFKEIGVDASLLVSKKLVLLEADISLDGLGLSTEVLAQVSFIVSALQPPLTAFIPALPRRNTGHSQW